MTAASTLAARSSQAVEEVLSRPGNDRCFDCEAECRSDAWASISHATVICISCAGSHRSFGVHVSYVRSLNLDTLREEEISALNAGGNASFRAFLEESSQNIPRHVWLALPLDVRYFTPAADLYRRRLQAQVEGRKQLPDAFHRVELPPARQPQQAGAPKWTPDSDAARCQLCQASFWMLSRRHHCRKCGRCVCSECSPEACRKPLPQFGYTQPCRQCKVCSPPAARVMEGLSGTSG
eukprot:TRINITY_DN85864_c0_g1_i1.p1 TRINITY_DN85864_c0_g1~~TRINITY_DN85864_c0_g1_i1.p1  ORF type:complete len:237 (-),score=30.36 TRINITY_DN85864_c0_g1_i1:59-769(-)